MKSAQCKYIDGNFFALEKTVRAKATEAAAHSEDEVQGRAVHHYHC